MRILLVEDDKIISAFIVKGLKQEGFAVDFVFDGLEGLFLALEENYDVAIIDIMIPKINGLTLIKKLREKKKQTPVIILSAKSFVDDRIKGLQAGGDDYMTKPFAFSELLARIQALIRRSNSIVESTTLTVDNLYIDLIRKKVFRKNKEIQLQPKELSLLEYLMRNKGKVVSKTMIMEHVWDYNFDPLTNVVETRICRLRDKIDRPFKYNLIKTIKGIGYVIEGEK